VRTRRPPKAARKWIALEDVLLLSVVIIWGFNFAVVKRVYIDLHPIAFNAVRFVIAVLAMVALLKLSGASFHVDREDYGRILWLGLLSNTFYQFLFVLGLARTKAGNSGLLMALTPIFAYLIGVASDRERFRKSVLGGIVLSLTGVAIVILFGAAEISFGATWRGDLMMIAAAFCWAWYSADSTLLLTKYGALRLTVFTMISGAAVMIPLSIPWVINQDWSGIAPVAWFGLGYSALLAIVYSYFVWAYALSRIGVAHTAVFANLTPIVALLGGWMLLAEQPQPAQVAGVILVLTGVFIVRSRRPLALPDE
jgi:drug/metabolite transporter (DMT)-like permease